MAGTQLPLAVARSLSALSGREQPLSIQCDNFMVLKTLVAESDVLSMAPWDVVAEDIQTGRLARLPLEAGALTEQSAYALISRAGHSLSPAAQAMREEILAEDRLFGRQLEGEPNS